MCSYANNVVTLLRWEQKKFSASFELGIFLYGKRSSTNRKLSHIYCTNLYLYIPKYYQQTGDSFTRTEGTKKGFLLHFQTKTFITELMGPRQTGQWPPLGCLRMVLAQSRQVWRWAQGRISPLRTLLGSMHTTQLAVGLGCSWAAVAAWLWPELAPEAPEKSKSGCHRQTAKK